MLACLSGASNLCGPPDTKDIDINSDTNPDDGGEIDAAVVAVVVTPNRHRIFKFLRFPLAMGFWPTDTTTFSNAN